MKLENVVAVPQEEIERIHSEALKRGGAVGVIDLNLLASAGAIRATFDGAPLYRSVGEIAAVYAWSIARNHPFVDGNKRTALVTALTFLELNGHAIRVGPEWVEFMVRVASDPTLDRRDVVDAFVRAMGADEEVT